MDTKRLVGPILFLAIAAVSAAAVLVRLAPDAQPLAVAFWRTAAVAVLLSPLLRPIGARDAGLVVVAGGLLAFHFWSWFASLLLISVMRSTVLVCLTPVWAGLIEWALLGHAPRRRFWFGIALALLGVAVLVGPDTGQGSLLGTGLATLGGVLSASYLVVGRMVRPRVHIGAYGALISGAAALWLLVLVGITGTPLAGFGRGTWLALAGLALGPQLLGHVGFNFAVRYVPAALVSAAILLEPVGATLLAWPLLGEVPTGVEAVGCVIILVGVATAALRSAEVHSVNQ